MFWDHDIIILKLVVFKRGQLTCFVAVSGVSVLLLLSLVIFCAIHSFFKLSIMKVLGQKFYGQTFQHI